jgi:hypothetical protein
MNDPKRRYMTQLMSARAKGVPIHLFGLDVIDDVMETVSPYHHRSFPRDRNWRDQHGNAWRQAGLGVFDFKLRDRERRFAYRTPSSGEPLSLTQSVAGWRVHMECTVSYAFISDPERVEDQVNPGQDTPVYSRNCGRGGLQIHKLRFTKVKQYGEHRT